MRDHRVERAWVAAMMAALLIASGCAKREDAGAPSGETGARPGAPGAVTDSGAIADQADVGSWAVRVMGTPDEPQVTLISRRGRVELDLPGTWRVSLEGGARNPDGDVHPGTDVNGDGIPDVVLQDWSGGAHCCFSYTVVSLGDSARVLGTIASGNAGARFVNLDRDPAFEVVTADDGFAYWPASYAESAAPRVVLDWTPEGLAPSAALTFHPVSEDSVLARAAKLRRDLRWNRPDEMASSAAQLFGPMAELYFAGHPELAQKFFERARPDAQREYLDRMLIEFGAILGRSDYWQALDRDLATRR